MTDHTAGSSHHARRAPKAEFYVYFVLIFVLAVPAAAVAWLKQLVTNRRLPRHGPLAQAWKDAGAITPEIFRH